MKLHEINLGELTVVFPGELVRPHNETNFEHIPQQLVFVAPIVHGRPSDVGTVCKLISHSSKTLLKGIYRAKVVTRENELTKLEMCTELGELTSDQLKRLYKLLLNLVQQVEGTQSQVFKLLKLTDIVMTPNQVIDLVCASFSFNLETRFKLFSELDLNKRYALLTDALNTILANTSSNVSIKQIRPTNTSISKPSVNDDLMERLQVPEIPEEGQKIIEKEFKRLNRINPQSMEYNSVRTYLETLADIPWSRGNDIKLTKQSISDTQNFLDKYNYGLQKPKKRLVEYVAVSFLTQSAHTASAPPILLLVGPPGVGKTSLAKSVAEAMRKPLHRISLGGVRDEAEIRGHRRTYVGAMPGTVVQSLIKAGSMSPVLVLDEIDKIAHPAASHGDPSAALLEVLDPAQNNSFKDHYVDFPIDLSNVTFIATANSLDSIPHALLDRMEVIQIEGYTYKEKVQIALRYLVPKQLGLCGLQNELEFDSLSILKIVESYTRESGVRELERKIGAICRGWAVQNLQLVIDGVAKTHLISLEDVEKFLGPKIYTSDVINDDVDKIIVEGNILHRHQPGVVNGLAYMNSGIGGIMTLEATLIPFGSGNLKLTGKLGKVMTESANIALSWVRANAKTLHIPASVLKNWDYHLHAPAGAIPKDGPSAGVAMTICLVSLLLNKPVPRDLAMTGEMTLRGKVLMVGGIREKLLGAHMAGAKRILLPYHSQEIVQNERIKGVEFPELELYYVKYIWDVLAFVWPEVEVGQRSMM